MVEHSERVDAMMRDVGSYSTPACIQVDCQICRQNSKADLNEKQPIQCFNVKCSHDVDAGLLRLFDSQTHLIQLYIEWKARHMTLERFVRRGMQTRPAYGEGGLVSISHTNMTISST